MEVLSFLGTFLSTSQQSYINMTQSNMFVWVALYDKIPNNSFVGCDHVTCLTKLENFLSISAIFLNSKSKQHLFFFTTTHTF